jgi:hypothetical protein
MKITTETGSIYNIDDHGICVKTDKDGNRIDSFKPLVMIPVPSTVKTFEEIFSLPHGNPVVDQRLYISGIQVWWLTTRVVEVEL